MIGFLVLGPGAFCHERRCRVGKASSVFLKANFTFFFKALVVDCVGE